MAADAFQEMPFCDAKGHLLACKRARFTQQKAANRQLTGNQ